MWVLIVVFIRISKIKVLLEIVSLRIRFQNQVYEADDINSLPLKSTADYRPNCNHKNVSKRETWAVQCPYFMWHRSQ